MPYHIYDRTFCNPLNLSLRYDRSRIVEHIRQFIRQLLCRLDPLGKAHGTARAGW
jgi:hypothetical protein